MKSKTIKTTLGDAEYWKANNEAVYEKILEKHRDINEEGNLTTDYFREELEAIGFSDVKIEWSGFASQGDGASFTGSFSYRPGKLPEKIEINEVQRLFSTIMKISKNHECSFRIYRTSHHYSHENTVSINDIEFFKRYGTSFDIDVAVKFEDEIEKACKDVMKYIYRAVEEEYDSLTSDEAVYDTLMANEYLFDEEGRIRE